MKYLLFDTNIYLDLIVNRRKDVHFEIVQSLLKLLKYEEVKLILPDIVDYETKKHIEEEIDKIGKNISTAIRQIDEIYWIVGIHDTEIDIEALKKTAIMPLRQSVDAFNSNRIFYANQLKGLIDQLFSYRTTVRIESDQNLLGLVMKRKIFKRAPFHKESKESYADALITEILINIKNYITLEPDDKVYFVTGNKADFSDSNNKLNLHEHIIEDLSISGIEKNVVYATIFSQLIKKDLADEVESANLSDEFSFELEDIESDFEDRRRESVGLPSLSSYHDIIESTLFEAPKAKELTELLLSLENEYQSLEDIFDDYESIIDFIESEIAYSDSCSHYLNIINDRLEENGFEHRFGKFAQVLTWIKENQNGILFANQYYIPDYFSLDEYVLMPSIEDNYHLKWTDSEIDPSSGNIDVLSCVLLKNEEIVAKGFIDVVYGYPPMEDDGNVGECSLDYIEVNFDMICEVISSIQDEILELRENNESIKDIFKEVLEID